MTTLPIDAIIITDRHRKDSGDIKGLAASITEVGLLHPIVVTAEHRLVAGGRRLDACRLLGFDEVPVTVVTNLNTAAALLKAEFAENSCRKEMTFSELLDLKVALEELERPKAEKRKAQAPGLPRGAKVSCSNLEQETPPPPGRTRTIVANALGKSATTMDKVAEVHHIAEAPETPEPVREIAKQAVEGMDREGKVDGYHRIVKQAESAHAINDFFEGDVDLDRLKLLKRFHDAVGRMGKDLLTFDPSIGAAFDDRAWESFDITWNQTERWFADIRKHRPAPGLHVMNGGRT